MIRSIEMKCFRKHIDTTIDFTAGLNVLRGPNEIGKTTITEAIGYALYGSGFLVDKFEQVVTWGRKEAELRVVLYITIGGIDYCFSRSKGGATCSYNDGTADRMVTGQKEVTAFSATLLGGDAKTASVLMLSSQAGLRGALDEGPAAVSALMSKLADFAIIDELLDTASKTLSLGATKPVEEKLAAAEVAAQQAKDNLLDESVLVERGQALAELAVTLGAAKAEAERLDAAADAATTELDKAVQNNSSVAAQRTIVATIKQRIEDTNILLADAVKAASNVPDQAVLADMNGRLIEATNHAEILGHYRRFQSIPAYPDVAWDEAKPSFDAALQALIEKRTSINNGIRDIDVQITTLKKQIITGDGKCPTCGHIAENHDHVLAANKKVEDEIARLTDERAVGVSRLNEVSDIAAMETIPRAAEKRQAVFEKIPLTYLKIDGTCYPPKVEWVAPIPSADAPDVVGIQKQIDALVQQERLAVQAEGRVTAFRSTISNYETELKGAEETMSRLALIDEVPLRKVYDDAFAAYSRQAGLVAELEQRIRFDEADYNAVKSAVESAKQQLVAAQARVEEYRKDLDTLIFNNELVKKLKSMKPMITDHLWNTVLAAVSNYFSTMRGEQSVVTKDAEGFKVNGRGGSLSGSTLDVLALAIRVALTKTFVPHVDFMQFDEPAHGCDETRTSNLLGFLSSVGMRQIVLASHDELSESVADNVIQLGD